MKKQLPNLLFLGILILLGCQPQPSTEIVQDKNLPRSTPEEQGIPSSAIRNLLGEIKKSGLDFHSIMIIRNDKVVAEGWWNPYKPEYKHTLYSLSKSFTSTAVGFAVQEGLITVTDKVISFFPDDLPDTVDDKLASMEIRHLLTMSSGHEVGTMPGMFADPDGNWPKGFFAQKLSYAPGEKFMYNTGATYMLSAIVQKKTGMTVLDYLNPRLFEPLGIDGIDWELCPKGVNVGGYGLRVKTEDIGKLGLLYLHKGVYNGENLFSEEWVEEATSAQIDNGPGEHDWAQGYGYQFWRCRPENLYRGDGAFGQYCIVMPDQNAVVAITSESKDMQASMNLIWDYLLPEMKEGSLAPDTKELTKLTQDLASLELGVDQLADFSEALGLLDGKRIEISENERGITAMTILWVDGKLTIERGGASTTRDFGVNNWKLNQIADSIRLGADITSFTAIQAGWSATDELIINRRFVETAHGDKFTISVDGNTANIKWEESASLWTPGNKGREVTMTGILSN